MNKAKENRISILQKELEDSFVASSEGLMEFRDETIFCLISNNRTPEEVVRIQSGDFSGTWEDFLELGNFSYDPTSEVITIDPFLKIVGEGWWMERNSSEGSEWWEYKSLPTAPENKKPFESLKWYPPQLSWSTLDFSTT